MKKADQRDNTAKMPGWAPPLVPKDEPPAKSLSLGISRWLAKASERSGTKFAPGTGKSS